MRCLVDIKELQVNSCPCVKISGLKNFDIGKIFDCGQCFRFDRVTHSKHENEFSGVALGRFVSFAQDRDTLYVYGSSLEEYEKLWKPYLNIEMDYDEVSRSILSYSNNKALLSAMDYGQGIRILAQDPFECIISFIISQNNNIPRIKKIIESVSKKCGAPIDIQGEMCNHLSGSSSLCSFPTADALVTLGIEGLTELKTGFRAKYIYDAACRYVDGRLSVDDILVSQSTEEAIEALCAVKGIGKKVASCALLFGFGKYDAFPIDVWMKRVAVKYFGEEGETLSSKSFGPYAGIAQQYLFYYERYRSLDGK